MSTNVCAYRVLPFAQEACPFITIATAIATL